MIFDKFPEMSSKWDRVFWTRVYYVTTIGNVNEETIRKYIREQAEESKVEDRSTSFRGASNNACDTSF